MTTKRTPPGGNHKKPGGSSRDGSKPRDSDKGSGSSAFKQAEEGKWEETGTGDEEEDDKFLDIGDMGVLDPEPEPEEIDDDEKLISTGVEDQEQSENVQTGRNAALAVLKQIRGTIVSDFSELANDEDRELYYDYLITNMLLWRDEFEDFLTKGIDTPTTPEYEKEKDAQSIGEGKEEEELFEIIDL